MNFGESDVRVFYRRPTTPAGEYQSMRIAVRGFNKLHVESKARIECIDRVPDAIPSYVMHGGA